MKKQSHSSQSKVSLPTRGLGTESRSKQKVASIMSSPDPGAIRQKVKRLRERIKRHDHLYYNLDRPEISDYDYDSLFQELVELETKYPALKTEDSPTARVPGGVLSHFEKVNHKKSMLSLQNTYNEQEIISFIEKTKVALKSDSVEFLLEPKLDGVALNLVYEKGWLVCALTRGDGQKGENVLENIKTIRSIPLSLPVSSPVLEIRGEVILWKEDFKKINQDQGERGLPFFANPRNMVAGSLRHLDPSIPAKRPLRFVAHSPGFWTGDVRDQWTFLKTLKGWSLPVFSSLSFGDFQRRLQEDNSQPYVACVLCQKTQEILGYWRLMEGMKARLPYEIDGVVIKVNDWTLQDHLGAVSRSPRWARAGKFTPERGHTCVLDIVVQVGRTGVLTPVAHLKPVRVGGVMITRATLHNRSEVHKKDIRVGDTVVIGRAGDVIPEIIQVDLSKREKSFKVFKMPELCPACAGPVQGEGDLLFCVNPFCSDVILRSLIHFVSKKAMNIESLGKKLILSLYEKKEILKFSDIYRLNKERLLKIEGMGEKSSQNIIDSIEKSKRVSLSSFIFALGLRHVGEQTADSLSRFFIRKAFQQDHQAEILQASKAGELSRQKGLDLAKCLSAESGLGKKALHLLGQAEEEELKAIPDIGDIVAETVRKAFSKKAFREEIEALLDLGVCLLMPEELKALLGDVRGFSSFFGQNGVITVRGLGKSGVLAGKSFVLTGVLPKGRGEVEKQIISLGGKVQRVVTRRTDFLLKGKGKGGLSSKEKQALALQVPILDWSAFQQKAGLK